MQGFRERETVAETHEIAAAAAFASGRGIRRLPDFACRALPPISVTVLDLAAANRAALRAQIADRIMRDIALLDLLDGDPDFEPEPAEGDADAELTAAEWTGIGAQRFDLGAAA